VRAILDGTDDRVIAVVGPCSVHDVKAAREYGAKLRALAGTLAEDVLVVMRVYFEKPRTTVGWKGAINDPDLDGTFKINKGLRLARGLLADLNDAGLPAGCEFLDTITPQYFSDLVTWGAIGARTAESQVHRQLTSGLSCPVGIKNSTEGSVLIAAQAVVSAKCKHVFPGITNEGVAGVVTTRGNAHAHVILRGGKEGPNYDAAGVAAAKEVMAKNGAECKLIIDCSHDNSRKDPRNQPKVCADIAAQVAAGDRAIAGVMIESFLVEGKQSCTPGPGAKDKLTYGLSITDGCVDFAATQKMLEGLAEAVRARRALGGGPE
jgi:3-deoxy-7-phosphoheptulonate synthase